MLGHDLINTGLPYSAVKLWMLIISLILTINTQISPDRMRYGVFFFSSNSYSLYSASANSVPHTKATYSLMLYNVVLDHPIAIPKCMQLFSLRGCHSKYMYISCSQIMKSIIIAVWHLKCQNIFSRDGPEEVKSKTLEAKRMLDLWKSSYFEVRAKIEMSGRDSRWEFDRKRLFDRTEYMSLICQDLHNVAQVSVSTFPF